MDDKLLTMLPHMQFPGIVLPGPRSLFYLKTTTNKKVLVVASKSAWNEHKEKIQKYFSEHLVVFAFQEPKESVVQELKTTAYSYNPSVIIGFGGGSAMDTAKVIKSDCHEAELVLVPTTFGTGSEASRYAVVVDEHNSKRPIASSKIMPDVVLLNPEFISTMPKTSIADNVMDALSHAVEGLVSRMANPLSDMFAIMAINLLLENAVDAIKGDTKAMEKMQLGGFISGFVQSSASVGLVHSFANYFGPRKGWAHGKAIGTFILPVINYNLQKGADYGKLALSGKLNAANILAEIETLIERLGFEKGKLQHSDFDMQDALRKISADICTKTNPVNPTPDELGAILEEVIGNE